MNFGSCSKMTPSEKWPIEGIPAKGAYITSLVNTIKTINYFCTVFCFGKENQPDMR